MKHSSEGVILVRKCNVFWESNLNAFKIWIGFYWNQFYTGAVPLTSQEWTAIGASANTLVWVGSSTLRCITLTKALRNILLPGGASQASGETTVSCGVSNRDCGNSPNDGTFTGCEMRKNLFPYKTGAQELAGIYTGKVVERLNF